MKKSAILLVFTVVIAAVVFSGCSLVVEVPEVINSNLENAKIALEKRGLRPVVIDSLESDDIPKNLICKQEPLPMSVVRRGSEIKLWISKGSGKVEIPGLYNAALNDVLRDLALLGLNPNVEFVYSEDVAKDNVISLDPAPGTMVQKETEVKVVVSMGEEPPKTAVVPKRAFMRKSAAEAKLKELGLEAKFIYRVHTEYYEGTLYYQTPKVGSVVPIGSTVTVYIATVLD